MTVKVAQEKLLSSNLMRWGACGGIAALLILFGCEGLQSASAQASDAARAITGSTAPKGTAKYAAGSAPFPPTRLAQASTVSDPGSATANDVISGRGFWQGVPSAETLEVPAATGGRGAAVPASPPPAAAANPPMRRPVASAGPKSTPWPLADRKDQEPFPNALSYAAQPSPMTTRALQAAPTKSHVTVHGDTTVAVKYDERAPAVPARNEAAVPAAPGKVAANKPSASVVRVGDRFNDPWLRAVIVTPSAQDYMEITLFGTPDFRSLGPYMAKPTSAVAVAFADDPHPGMATDRFAGDPVTFVSTVPFGTPRPGSR